MSLTDPNTIHDVLGFESDQDREEFEAERLQLDILHTVSQQMERCNLTKSELASRLGVSRSYISQLFAGDTPLNLRTLAKLERVLGGRFRVGIVPSTQTQDSITELHEQELEQGS